MCRVCVIHKTGQRLNKPNLGYLCDTLGPEAPVLIMLQEELTVITCSNAPLWLLIISFSFDDVVDYY